MHFVGSNIALLSLGDVIEINIVIQNVIMDHGVYGVWGSRDCIFYDGDEREGDDKKSKENNN